VHLRKLGSTALGFDRLARRGYKGLSMVDLDLLDFFLLLNGLSLETLDFELFLL
jgi:hypothetical protein